MTFKILVATFSTFLFMIYSAEARVTIKERTKYYSVTGKNGISLMKSILKRGPKLGRSRHAIATTNVTLKITNIKAGIRGRKCVIKSARVRLNLVYKYPKWKNRRGASARMKKAWNRFYKELQVHEKTHGKIAKQFARDMDKAIKRHSARISRGCKNFARNANRKFKKLSKAHSRKQKRFDRREHRARSRISRLQFALIKSR